VGWAELGSSLTAVAALAGRRRREAGWRVALGLGGLLIGGAGCGSSDPSDRLVIGGAAVLFEVAAESLIEVEALLDGRVIGSARVPQGVAGAAAIPAYFTDIPTRAGRHRVGVRLAAARPGGPRSHRIRISVAAVRAVGFTREVAAQGEFTDDRVMKIGDVVEFTFDIP